MMNKGLDPSKSLARVIKWRLENPTKYKEQKRRRNQSIGAKNWRARNRGKLVINQTRYVTKNKKEVAYRRRAANLRKKYSMDLAHYNILLSEQDGVCAICGKYVQKRPLSVDHDHETGIVRGLLCVVCNTKLGVLEDAAFTEKANVYLDKHRCDQVPGAEIAFKEKTRRK